MPVALAGAACALVAATLLVLDPPAPAALAGILALLAAAAFAEAFPVPIEGVKVGATSLAGVFIVAASVIYGWAPGVLVAFAAMLAVESAHRRPPPSRTMYNTALYTVAAATAGACAAALAEPGLAWEVAAAVAGWSAFYLTGVPLLAVVIARVGREPYASLVGRYLRWTLLPAAIMASVTVMLVVLWKQSPLLAAPLVGPLLALALYQRSVHRELEAMRLARTDPLTGLGNVRAFDEAIDRSLSAAASSGEPLTVCLLDVDDFKAVNDELGHPAGDRILAELATRLRQSGEAFRLGGDEFGLLLPAHDEARALRVAEQIVRRVVGRPYGPGVVLGVSAGVASFPRHAEDPDHLHRLADRALYDAKLAGKNRVAGQGPEVAPLARLRRLSDESDRAARLRAAASLARAVDERDAYAGRHSLAVGELAARVAERLALDPNEVELARVAGRLHDLGKLAVSEEILRKAGPLTADERRALERHPEIGFRMLDSLGIEPVATWVLHHHERWDGSGYPNGLAREEIPLGARIIFVADAFDAMTSDRVYRRAIASPRALEELERCAGTQFDPAVVAVFRALVGASVDTKSA